MRPFQAVAIPIVAVLAVLSLRALLRGDRPRWVLLLRFVVFAAAAVAIWNPESTTRLARALGIGRGADLLIYVVAIFVVVAFFYFYQTTRRLERDITRLVRELALERAASVAPPPRSHDEAGVESSGSPRDGR
jgi:hypothetical protein